MVGYEAGPAGFSLYRFLTELNVQCAVIAPGSLVRRPADRVKTDRRDARMIAHGLRNGDVDRVAIPTPENEATRDFLRARDDLREELKHYKQRLNQLLLRHGLQYTDGSKWTRGHRQWIQNLEFAVDRLKQTAELYYYRIVELEEKILQMDQEIQQIAQSEPYAEPVGRLRCFRGIDWLVNERRRGQPEQFIAYANRAARRLSKKFFRLVFRGKRSQVAVTAVARELAGFVWGAMVGQTDGIEAIDAA